MSTSIANFSGRAARAVVAVSLLALTTTALTGCNRGLQEENELLLQENAELRDQRAQLEAALASEASRRASVEDRAGQLRRELEEARAQTRRQPGTADATGFEGIAGVGGVRPGRGEIIVDMVGDVLFDSGSATLKPEARRSLDRIAEIIRSQYGGRMIRVEGYTDSDPIRRSQWKTNERLSAERAMAVEAYLVSRGIDNNMIYSAAFGPARPRATKRESRRVEIVILDTPN